MALGTEGELAASLQLMCCHAVACKHRCRPCKLVPPRPCLLLSFPPCSFSHPPFTPYRPSLLSCPSVDLHTPNFVGQSLLVDRERRAAAG